MSDLLRESTEQKLFVSSVEPAVESASTADDGLGANSNASQTNGTSSCGGPTTSGDATASSGITPAKNSHSATCGDAFSEISTTSMSNDWNEDLVVGKCSANAPREAGFWSTLFNKKTSGELRHQRVVATCLSISLAVLGFSTIDVRALSEKTVTIDKHMNVIPDSSEKHDLLATNRYEEPISSENVRCLRSNNYATMGYADNAGKILLPADYSETLQFTEGLGAVKPGKTLNGKDYPLDKWVYVDQNGKTILDKNYGDAKPFHNGVASVSIDSKGKLIDKQGNTIASTGSDKAADRWGNCWEFIGENGKIGLLGTDGTMALAPIYDSIKPFEQKNEDSGYPNGIDYPNKQNLSDGKYFKITKNGLSGVIDANGKILVAPMYNDIAAYNKGYATFKQNGLFGYVDGQGNILVKPQYKSITAYDTISAGVNHAGDWTVLNGKGEPLPLKIDGAVSNIHSSWLSEGCAPFIKANHVGFVDKFGNIKIKPIYDFASRFSNGYSVVSLGGLYHFINKQGVMQNTPGFSSIGLMGKTGVDAGIPGPLHTILDSQDIERTSNSIENAREAFKSGLKGES